MLDALLFMTGVPPAAPCMTILMPLIAFSKRQTVHAEILVCLHILYSSCSS